MLLIKIDDGEDQYWNRDIGWTSMDNASRFNEQDQLIYDLPENGIWVPYSLPPAHSKYNSIVLANHFFDHLLPEDIEALLKYNLQTMYENDPTLFASHFQEMLEIFAEFGKGKEYLEEFEGPFLKLHGE